VSSGRRRAISVGRRGGETAVVQNPQEHFGGGRNVNVLRAVVLSEERSQSALATEGIGFDCGSYTTALLTRRMHIAADRRQRSTIERCEVN
jgi:hypothetical protein